MSFMTRKRLRPITAVSIATSDSGGGAGIQADLLTFAAHRVHGATVIVAATAQNTRRITAVEPLPRLYPPANGRCLYRSSARGGQDRCALRRGASPGRRARPRAASREERRP